MGHLLSTVNPDAAAELTVKEQNTAPQQPVENIVPDGRYLGWQEPRDDRPPVGTWVMYVCRPGEGRAGKPKFPALVMHHEPDGHILQQLHLMIVYDVDDMVMMGYVPRVSDEIPWPAWHPIEQVRPHAPIEGTEPSRLNRLSGDILELLKSTAYLADQIAKLKADLDRTRSAIYGEYEDPGQAVMDILVSFESKLKDLTKRIKELEAR